MEYLNVKQDRGLSSECRRLRQNFDRAQNRAQVWRGHVQNLLDKINEQEGLLDSLRQQRQRTGDDGFDVDIREKQEKIRNLMRQVEEARKLVHQWEDQVSIIEREMIANDCGRFA